MPLNFPSSPGLNQTHSIGDRVWRWNGTAWQYVPTSGSGGGGANSFLASDTAPTAPIAGDLWLNTLDGILYIYYTDQDTSQWVEFNSGSYGVSGTGIPNDYSVTTSKLVDDAVTYAKIQNISTTDRLLGRSTAGAGDIEEIVCTAAGRALLDDADATAQRNTLGLKTGSTTNITTSTNDPTGGVDGDIWIKYTA